MINDRFILAKKVLISVFAIALCAGLFFQATDAHARVSLTQLQTQINDLLDRVDAQDQVIEAQDQQIEDLQGQVDRGATPVIWSGYCSSNGRAASAWNTYCTDKTDFNTAGSHLTVTSGGTFTVQVAGYYRVNAWAISNTSAYPHVRLVVNGTTIYYGHEYSGDRWVDNFMDVTWKLNVGDTFYVTYYNHGGNNYAYYSGNSIGAHSRLQVTYEGPPEPPSE